MSRSATDARGLRALTLLLILGGCLLSLAATWHRTPTLDEPRHLQMGRQVLMEGSWARFDNSKMPVNALNALPTLVTGPPRDGDPQLSHRDWFWPRAPQVLWLASSALLAAAWARRLFGERAGLVAAGFVVLDPNLQAHAGLVTTDMPCAFFVLAACYACWRALEGGRLRQWALAGAVLGLAQAAKFTAVFLVPILGLALPLAALWRWRRGLPRSLGPRRLAVYLLAAGLALNAAYGFEGCCTPARDIAWRSRLLAPMAELALPLPLPRPWVEGLDWVRSDDEHGSGNIYSEGRYTAQGQGDHYLRAASRKFPLPLLLLGPLALLWPRRQGRASLLLTWPVLFLAAWFSLAFNFQIGTRYLLPIVPLLAVSIARLPLTLGALGAALCFVSGWFWFPHGLSYQNERLRDPVEAWQHLGDSDLEWGQNGLARVRWEAQNPGGLADVDVPGPGPMLVSANRLTGVWGHPSRLACLRERFPPSQHLVHTWYPYDLDHDDLAQCFPSQEYLPGPGRWSFPSGGGTVLLAARVRGAASLQAGAGVPLEHRSTGRGEALLAVLLETPPGTLEVSVEGDLLGLYIDGWPHPDVPVEER